LQAMRQRALVAVLMGVAAVGVVMMMHAAFAAASESTRNLLANTGFEMGWTGRPAGWRALELAGGEGTLEFDWSGEAVHSGDRAVAIVATGTRCGVWQQCTEVDEDVVYELTGYVACSDVARAGGCRLQLVFRDGDGRVVERVDFPGHNGTRPFELDYPAKLKIRAPRGAVRVEVNAVVEGPGTGWFDDVVFRRAAVGEIVGVVRSAGAPVPGATVEIWGEPWGKAYRVTAGEDGSFRMREVPVAHPRYILIARADGYRSAPVGDVDVREASPCCVDFELMPGEDVQDVLEVRYGVLALAHPAPRVEVPRDALVPEDTSGYPEAVRPYLESDACITSEDPAVERLAASLLASVAVDRRHVTHDVAWAVYSWVSRNINHDAVYGDRTAFLDVTSGIWQTIQPGGWCFGESFYDWCYRPAEVLEQGTAICIEHAWLACALLRCLGIPARAHVGSAQFWAQDGDGNGEWIGISTSSGSNSYREHGTLGAGFGGMGFPASYSVTSTPLLHEDWDLGAAGLWHERHPWSERYPGSDAGRVQALRDLQRFSAVGEAPRGRAGSPAASSYEIRYSAITLSLLQTGDEKTFDVRFPMITASDAYEATGEWAYWTNHPECVTGSWVEEITNPPVEGVERWRHITFDLSLLGE